MRSVTNIEKAIYEFKKDKNKNLNFLLTKRFNWMKKFISENDKGLEVGAGAGFSKKFITNKNFLISDFANYDHLDIKNIDAQDTKLEKQSFDYVIASNMIHHVPYPIKFLNEMHRILKPNGKLIIQEAHPSIVFQLITLLMRHEGFDFTKNVWDKNTPATDADDLWAGNSSIPYLIFSDKAQFKKNLGDKFNIKYKINCECLLFLNSGGVTSKTLYLPLPNFFLKFISYLDKFLSFIAPDIFSLAYKVVLEKKG